MVTKIIIPLASHGVHNWPEVTPVLNKQNSGDVIIKQLGVNFLSPFKFISGASSFSVLGRPHNISPYSSILKRSSSQVKSQNTASVP